MAEKTREQEQEYTGYRWVVLILFALIPFFISFLQFQPAYFAQEIMAEFGMGTQGFAQLTSFPMMVGIFLAFVAGSAADRFGIKKCALLGLLVSAIAATARYFSPDFGTLLISSVFMGVASSTVIPNVAKFAMQWFPPRQISLAVGIGMAMGTAGIAASQLLTGVLFPDYRSAFFVGFIIMIAMTVAWLLLARDKQPAAGAAAASAGPSVKQGILASLKSRGIWTAGFGLFFFQGFNVTVSGLLITALVVVWGTDPVVAGLIAGLFTVGSTLGSAFLPNIISRNRYAKPICIALPIVCVALVMLGWFVNADAARLVIFPVAGLMFGALLSSFMVFPSILPEIDEQTAGAAGGLMTTLMMIGSVVMPSFVITPIAGEDYFMVIVLSCVCVLVCAVLFALLPSVYRGASRGE